MDLIEENASTELIGKLMPSWQPMDPMNLDYCVSVKLENIAQNERNIVGILIELKRKFGRNFIELILPPSLLVLVSWVSTVAGRKNRMLSKTTLQRAFFPQPNSTRIRISCHEA